MIRCSILVPVYNAAKWLPAFVRSMSRQQFINMELLFLDDCSTDDSVNVLKQEIVNNGLSSVSRLLFHKENRGVSEARQTLLDAAKGEYIIFADPDDEVDFGMYEELLARAYSTGADFVWEDFFEGSHGRRVQSFEGNAYMFIKALLRGVLHGGACNKLIRRQFILDSGSKFPSGPVCLCEDLDFLCQVLFANPKIAYNNGCHYHYLQVSNSATHELSEKSFQAKRIVETRLGVLLSKEQFSSDLRMWRKGNRLASFLSKNVGNEFFYDYLEDVRDLSGLSTNVVLKFLFWIAVQGGRSFALYIYQFLQRLVGILRYTQRKFGK